MSCDRQWQVRAVDEGRLPASEVAAFERHAEKCADCRRERTDLRQLRELARELPRTEPDDLSVRRVRGRVLRDAMAPRPVRRRPLAVVAAVAALTTVLVLLVFHRVPASPAFAGSVVGGTGAVWEQERHGTFERVTLHEGDVTIHVRKQAADERFLVGVPDGEIEVRGTTFEVAVRAGRTWRVHVIEGVVVVRIGEESSIAAGETWPSVEAAGAAAGAIAKIDDGATEPATASPVHPSATRTTAPPPVSSPPPVRDRKTDTRTDRPAFASASVQPPAADGAELAEYEEAVAASRANDSEGAATRLRAFVLAHPSSPLLDDALFLEAASLARAGRVDAAALVAEEHVTRFPASFHRKDAAILVARLRRDRGDCPGARAVLSRWIVDGAVDPAIAAALGRCTSP